LKAKLGEIEFIFYEGLQVITDLVPGGLARFKAMITTDQTYWREKAITTIQETAIRTRKTAFVTGHYVFFNEGDEVINIFTTADAAVYSHILYLDVPARTVSRQRDLDCDRIRP